MQQNSGDSYRGDGLNIDGTVRLEICNDAKIHRIFKETSF